MRADTLVMLSGGLDSAVLAYQLKMREEREIRGIYFYLGRAQQTNELASLNSLSVQLNLPIQRFELTDFDKNFYGLLPPRHFAADEVDMVEYPRSAKQPVQVGGFASLLALSAFYAHAIEVTEISVGILDRQMARYPGMREFLDKLSESLSILQSALPQLKFHAPFADMSKADIVKLGHELKVPFEDTWSCYVPGDIQCGVCVACESRRVAFDQAGVADPTTYLDEHGTDASAS